MPRASACGPSTWPLPARVLGRPAPARRDRARLMLEPRSCRRRAGLGARRLDPGPGPQPADGLQQSRRRLRLRLAQPRGGRADRRRGDGDVPRQASVERAPEGALFAAPRHPYTRALLASTPRIDAARRRHGRAAAARSRGELPSPLAPPSGCVFRTRCPLRVRAAPKKCRCWRTPAATRGRPASARTRSAERRAGRRPDGAGRSPGDLHCQPHAARQGTRALRSDRQFQRPVVPPTL